MIISFSISNFRSFSSEETFSLVASNRLAGGHEGHAMPIPDSDEKALVTSVIYGANGAGKSNLFRGLRFLRTMALDPRRKNSGTGREVFRFSDDHSSPSSFDLQFVAGDRLYRFGLVLDDHRVIEEWLVQVKGQKETPLYERITNEKGDVKIEAKKFSSISEKLAALATVGGPQNQTFLATIRATLEAGDYGSEIESVLNWFLKLTLIAPGESYAMLGHELVKYPDFLDFASKFLRFSSTGVDHLEVQRQEISEDDLKGLLPSEVAETVIGQIPEEGTTLIRLGEGNELLVEKTDESHIYRIAIQAAHEHQGRKGALELTDESDGTRRLLNLIPALHKLQKENAVFFIDEIDRSMHPKLVWEFLEFFLKSCVSCQRQLIVTTHESNLLDQDLLRRDEIWIAEKDQIGATRLYSLADFKVRKDLEIRKHYLAGRFGAIPFLGNLDRLLAKAE
jgi:AAA15 family ATPase/GTPase